MTGVETMARTVLSISRAGRGSSRSPGSWDRAGHGSQGAAIGHHGVNYKRTTQPQPKLGPWVETLTAILEAETKVPKRERRSTQRLFEELRGRGYDGAHDSVDRFVKAWRAQHARAPVQASSP